jgi:hypothetical protein
MEGTRIAVLFRVWGGPHAPQSAPKTPSEADLFAYAAVVSTGHRNKMRVMTDRRPYGRDEVRPGPAAGRRGP